MKNAFMTTAALTMFMFTFGQDHTNMKETHLSQYIGEWTNVDQNTDDITKVIITNEGGLSIQAFGSCVPKDCDWGTVKIHKIWDSTNRLDDVLPFDYGIAIWEADFANYTMKLKVGTGSNPELFIEAYTIFKDESGRSNHHLQAIMRKKS